MCHVSVPWATRLALKTKRGHIIYAHASLDFSNLSRRENLPPVKIYCKVLISRAGGTVGVGQQQNKITRQAMQVLVVKWPKSHLQ